MAIFVTKIFMQDSSSDRISVSFSSSGFYFFYHLGVVDWLQQHYDFSADHFQFLGSSGGSIPAHLLALEIPVFHFWEGMIIPSFKTFSKKLFGPLWVFYKVTRDNGIAYMPPEAYKKAEGKRLMISVTRFERMKFRHQSISQFDSNREILDTIAASGHIPFYTYRSFFFRLKGMSCIDGGLTNLQPVIDQKTICISPYRWSNLNPARSFLWEGNLASNAQLVLKGYQDAELGSSHFSLLEPYRLKKTPPPCLKDFLKKTYNLQLERVLHC